MITKSPVTGRALSPGGSIRSATADLSPSNFAMVMATGIISTGAHLLGMPTLSLVLFIIAALGYAILWLLNLVRLACYPARVGADLLDHTRSAGFYTAVAATCVVGSQSIRLFNDYRIAFALWLIGLLLWVVLTYAIFTGLTIKEHKPTLDEGISGAWLLAVVATQSVALLSGQLSDFLGPYRLATNYFAFCMWLWGGMLYIWMISLIFYRYTFFRFSPGDLTPPYWINMGAMAISSLTGTVLISNAPHAPFLNSTLPFLKGFTVFYWATGTWWLPMLVILAIWRHVYRRFPLRYDPLYWGAVFPLGMHAACTFQMGRTMDLPFLEYFPHLLFPVALAAWLAAFVGLMRQVARGFTTAHGVPV